MRQDIEEGKGRREERQKGKEEGKKDRREKRQEVGKNGRSYLLYNTLHIGKPVSGYEMQIDRGQRCA